MDWIKNHPIIAGCITALLFAIWTLPQWLAQMWPLFVKDKTLPEWLQERRWPGMTQHFVGWATLFLGAILILLLAVIVIVTVSNARSERKLWDERQVTVYKKTYTNESVDIDGKIFDHCNFNNVTLFYRGTGPSSFVECQFSGTFLLATDHKAAKTFVTMSARLRAAGLLAFNYASVDKDGKIESFLPLSQPAQQEWNPNQIRVENKNYVNEAVEIDSKIFAKCSFTNVTLVFHGKGPVSFEECKWGGQGLQYVSDHNALKAHTAIDFMLRDLATNRQLEYKAMDNAGQLTDYRKATFQTNESKAK